VVLFALDADAGTRLRTARAEGRYHRRYVAIASSPKALPDAGTWTTPIGRARDPRLRVAGENAPDAKAATTVFRRVASAASTYELLAVEPITGRTHQIRVHASNAGAPLVGDAAYGGPARIVLENGAVSSVPRIALHAARVSVPGAEAVAPIPEELRALWRSLGGEPESWRLALERW
jgi:23S rRNA-/tRNA-specific pseudouridylate synthase